MRRLAFLAGVLAAARAGAQDAGPSEALAVFFQALKTGDSTVVDSMVSEDALDNVQAMLDALKMNLRSDREGVVQRLNSAGYGVTAEEVSGWDAREYLMRTVALPVMMARYMPYEMQVVESSLDDGEAAVSLLFSTASGFTMESEAVLVMEDGGWKVSAFLGLNSFP